MDFHEVLFPEAIAYGATGGPQFLTRIAMSAGGEEQRVAAWERPRLRYELATGIGPAEEMRELVAFFRARRGRAHGFRFHDWLDDRAVGELLGEGDGVRKVFPLLKHYASGSVVEWRRIHKPVEGTVVVYRNGVEVTSGVTVDSMTGKITFAVAPAAEELVTADFEFHVPVRFDTDRLAVAMLGKHRFQSKELPLVELRMED